LIEGNKTWKVVKIKENEADEITGVKLLGELEVGYRAKRQKDEPRIRHEYNSEAEKYNILSN
jgi:hypothetical protein